MTDDIRCSILGNAGGGKSILARSLASRCDIPLHELDAYLWTGNWQAVPSQTFADRHDAIIDEARWVIDGFGLPDTVQPRLDRSTHVVHVDLPIWLHFALAAERQTTWRLGELKHPPGGMEKPPPTKRLFELMWRLHTEMAPALREALDAAKRDGKPVETIDSLERLRELQFDPASIFR